VGGATAGGFVVGVAGGFAVADGGAVEGGADAADARFVAASVSAGDRSVIGAVSISSRSNTSAGGALGVCSAGRGTSGSSGTAVSRSSCARRPLDVTCSR
jgi:hypothetical protein